MNRCHATTLPHSPARTPSHRPKTAGAAELFGETVYAGHPLFVERMAQDADPADTRRLRTEILAQLAAQPHRHLCDRLGRAALALDSDSPEPVDDVVAAAQQALRLGDLP